MGRFPYGAVALAGCQRVGDLERNTTHPGDLGSGAGGRAQGSEN